jgi:hypothetical protein
MRRVLKAVASGQSLGDLSTLENEASVEEVKSRGRRDVYQVQALFYNGDRLLLLGRVDEAIDDPFDFHFEPTFRQRIETGAIVRERNCTPDPNGWPRAS